MTIYSAGSVIHWPPGSESESVIQIQEYESLDPDPKEILNAAMVMTRLWAMWSAIWFTWISLLFFLLYVVYHIGSITRFPLKNVNVLTFSLKFVYGRDALSLSLLLSLSLSMPARLSLASVSV